MGQEDELVGATGAINIGTGVLSTAPINIGSEFSVSTLSGKIITLTSEKEMNLSSNTTSIQADGNASIKSTAGSVSIQADFDASITAGPLGTTTIGSNGESVTIGNGGASVNIPGGLTTGENKI